MPDAAATPFAYLVVNLARLIRPGEVTFSGVNSTVAMLACLLAKRAYDFDFTYLTVSGGIDPTPSHIPHSSSDPALYEGSAAIFANQDFYDLCTRGGMDLCYLGCAQVDAYARTNVSCIGDWHAPKVRLPGGGGAAVMMPTAKRCATWRAEHSTRTLVEKLDFITAAGNMMHVVTPLAVFSRERVDARLHLESWDADAARLEDIRARTGFAFDATDAKPTLPATAREAAALRALDPDGAFAAEAAIRV